MSEYRIEEVKSLWGMIRFIKFPNDLYKDCKQYVPSLYLDQIKTFRSCASAKYCPHRLWVVKKGRKIVGRICAMVNPRFNEYKGTKRVRFGWFDTINDIEVARMLIGKAEEWARELGMEEVHGPLYYNTLGKQGMLSEGYENLAPFNCYYNYPYYNDLVKELGYKPEFEWVQLKVKADQGFPDRFKRIRDRLMERNGLTFADIDVLKKDKDMVKRFFDTYNASFAAMLPNFVPFTDEEIEEEAKGMIGMVDERLCTVVMDKEGEIAAFGIATPSLSRAMQKAHGSMLLMGLQLMKAKKDFKNIDLLLLGAAPKWQNSGISTVFHVSMAQKFVDNGAKWAITNPQLVQNKAVNVWEDYEHEPYMRRICYIKSL